MAILLVLWYARSIVLTRPATTWRLQEKDEKKISYYLNFQFLIFSHKCTTINKYSSFTRLKDTMIYEKCALSYSSVCPPAFLETTLYKDLF